MAEVHRRNAARLARIIEGHGWPGRSLVGEDGARAAWLVLQHAIGHPDLQRWGLVLLREAVARGEAPAAEAAVLEDRIAFFEGRPQRYGTQLDWDGQGRLSPHPIEDVAGVDERRRAGGLPTLEAILERARDGIAATGERAPTDLAERKKRAEEWAGSVGWRDT